MDQYVAFYLDNDLFGINIYYTLEVNEFCSYTDIPGSRPGIAGLLNLRGEIVTVFNLKQQLGFEDCSIVGKTSRNIILKTAVEIDSQLIRRTEVPSLGEERVGFRADRIKGIVEAVPEKTPPVDAVRFNIELIESVCEYGNELLLVLDIARLVETNLTTIEI